MNRYNYNYDVIVAGGGHAGAEAAHASARLGAKTLLITMNLDHISQMSCNPAIGGIAKGHVVREIDALGGIMAKVTEAATLQFRILNRGKGPAVWSPRAQCDKLTFQQAVKYELENSENLLIHQAEVESFILRNNKFVGLTTQFGDEFYSKSIVLTPGTFLHGILHYGDKSYPGGRAGDFASNKLANALQKQLGLKLGRLKTGTPQRIMADSIDFTQMVRQYSEEIEENFCFFNEKTYPHTGRKDLNCFLVKTSKKTAEIVNENLDKSPIYQGKIKATGTRYCPSFEDKIVRFPHHETHTLHLEPEGEFTKEYYINGFSTSLPVKVQWEMLRSIPGLEKAEISRYAYAIEYDCVFPNQLDRSLSLKKFENLFLAGQINGTSGYEEAGGQGLIAGLNAARYSAGKSKVELGRDTAYIGVMIDDLVTKDIIEPYRLFTSRAEYRLHLRQDCADLRLCRFAYDLGLLPESKFRQFKQYEDKLNGAKKIWSQEKYEGITLESILKKYKGKINAPYLFPPEKLNLDPDNNIDRRVFRQLAIQAHYKGYLEREKIEIQRLGNMENMKLPEDFDYAEVKGLRNESRDKLIKIRPTTIAQASRIDGVTPAELTILRIYLKKLQKYTNED
ncbi:MAG: tRNA uridine-5-carboxymethylaminomethyl(34) synthesis enzyme MnmG [Victivallales bacterium]|nr:tRNA uridine-5-carboxymethylaminomethyl(34) synthesis enzyme MnmG [Victivallales bacterium]